MFRQLRTLFYKLSKNPWAYRLANRLVSDHDGENNADIQTNGELLVLKKILPDCHVVFDVGANQGDWARTVLAISPNINLHCFEPSASTFKKLQAGNFPKNVVLNKLALGSKPEERSFYVYGNGSTVNSLYERTSAGLSSKQQEIITIETIANYCQKNSIPAIDLLKIDVEGHELEVLKGCGELLAQGRIKLIQVEYGGTFLDAGIFLKDIFNYFTTLEYSFYKLFPDGPRPVKYNALLENFHYANYLIVHNKYRGII
jgi:FkbM family methyltransferase